MTREGCGLLHVSLGISWEFLTFLEILEVFGDGRVGYFPCEGNVVFVRLDYVGFRAYQQLTRGMQK